MTGRYGDASALRAALEERLRRKAHAEGVTIDRLRKEAAFTRLLQRFVQVAPEGWALKGGVALIWRTGNPVRATKDVDANWRRAVSELDGFLSAVEDCHLDDGFAFKFGDPRVRDGEGDNGALRFPARARMAGRTFEQFHLDINLVPDDPRPVEMVQVTRNLFEFASMAPPAVPMLPVAQQLAEKLHACVREYAGVSSGRSKDGFDTVVIGASVAVPSARVVREAVRSTFELRRTPMPSTAPALPEGWRAELLQFLADYPLNGVANSVDELVERFSSFWNPVLTDDVEGMWQADSWTWQP